MSDSAIRQPSRAPAAVLIAVGLIVPLTSGIAGAHGKNRDHTATVIIYAEGLINQTQGHVVPTVIDYRGVFYRSNLGQILKIDLHCH